MRNLIIQEGRQKINIPTKSAILWSITDGIILSRQEHNEKIAYCKTEIGNFQGSDHFIVMIGMKVTI